MAADDTWRTELVPSLSKFAQAFKRHEQAIIDLAHLDPEQHHQLSIQEQEFLQRTLRSDITTCHGAILASKDKLQHFTNPQATMPLGTPQETLEELIRTEVQLSAAEDGITALFELPAEATHFAVLELLLEEDAELINLLLNITDRYGIDGEQTASKFSVLKDFHTQLRKTLPDIDSSQDFMQAIDSLVGAKAKPETFFTERIVDCFLATDEEGKDAVGSWSTYWQLIEAAFPDKKDKNECRSLGMSAMMHDAVRKLGTPISSSPPEPDGSSYGDASQQDSLIDDTQNVENPDQNGGPTP